MATESSPAQLPMLGAGSPIKGVLPLGHNTIQHKHEKTQPPNVHVTSKPPIFKNFHEQTPAGMALSPLKANQGPNTYWNYLSGSDKQKYNRGADIKRWMASSMKMHEHAVFDNFNFIFFNLSIDNLHVSTLSKK